MLEQTSGVDLYGVNKNTHIRSSNLEIMFCGLPRDRRHIWNNLRKDGLAHLGYNIAYQITLFFLFMLTILNQTQ
jgi:hypothetical protein